MSARSAPSSPCASGATCKVYYTEHGGFIKIGFTRAIEQRMRALAPLEGFRVRAETCEGRRVRHGYEAGNVSASEMSPPEAFTKSPECGLYMVNPFSGWAAQHIMLPGEKLFLRFVPLTTKDGKFTGRLAKMEVCAGCARRLDREYDASEAKDGNKGDDAE